MYRKFFIVFISLLVGLLAGGTSFANVQPSDDLYIYNRYIPNSQGLLNKISTTQEFIYDYLGRLTSASSPYQPAYNYTYDYNTIGNMISVNGLSYGYEDNAGPHALTFDDTYTYTYDYNGNMTSRSDGRAFVYDYENRLKAVKDNGSAIARFRYDPHGRRIMKDDGSGVTYYMDNDFERLPNNMVRKWFFAGGMKVAARKSPGEEVTYYHPDHLGGGNVVTDKDGNTRELILYYPYGLTRLDDHDPDGFGPRDIEYKFTGKELDSSTGLYYYGARYYDPAIAHFITADTVADLSSPQNLNRYSYCLNNPIRYVDPDGNIVWDIIDAGFFVSSLYKFAKDPSWSTAGDLGLDTVSLLPLVPSIGSIKLAGKGVSKAGKAIKGGKASKNTSKILFNSSKQLQKKFKHAKKNGITGNYSKANATKFSSAINKHINSPNVRAIQGTYHKNPVTHFSNS